ncbi:MAG: hypothetical protein KDE48_24590, partial [Anaerolineales bacterium]|nr:hypothetical protein [Anaerolineales bacterium]
GGFMGLNINTAVDTQALPDTEALSLEQMIHETQFFELPENLNDPTKGADQFNYTLRVETPEQDHTIHTTDITAPDSLRPLLSRLTYLARQKPREK